MGLKDLLRKSSDGNEESLNEDSWDGDPTPFTAPPTSTPNLTSAHVAAVRFHTSKPGYAFSQVEQFVQQAGQTLADLETALYDRDVALYEAGGEISRLEEQVVDLQSTIEVFRAKGDVLANASGDFVTESQLADTTNERESHLAAEVEELRASLSEAQSLTHQLAEARDTLQRRLEEAESSRALQSAAVSDPALQIALDETVEERDSLLTQVADLIEEVKRLEDAVRQADAQNTELQQRIDELVAAAADAGADRSQVAFQEAMAERDAAVSAAARAESEKVAALQAKDEAILERDGLRKQIDALIEERDTAFSQKEAAEAAKDAALQDVGRMSADLDSVKAENEQLSHQLAALTSDYEALENEAQLLRDGASGAAAPSSESEAQRVAELEFLLAQTQAELVEVTQAEAELRHYVDTTLAEWQREVQQSDTAEEAPQDSSEFASEHGWVNAEQEDDGDDDEWGDAPTAARPDAVQKPSEPAPTVVAPEIGESVPPPPPTDPAVATPTRAHAPLIDAPEVRSQQP